MGNNKGYVQYSEKRCVVCGRVGEWHTYCSDACKQKAYRERRKEKNAGEFRALDSYLREDLPSEDYAFVIDALNRVYGEDNALAVNDAVIRLVETYHAKIVKARKVGRRL